MHETGETMRVAMAAARLDRLPLFSFHRRILWLVGFCFFFELGDINTFSFAAPAILLHWQVPVSTIAWTVSATFLGMCIGATTGGWIADRIGRKRALVLSITWFSVFSLLNAMAMEPVSLFIARLLTGIGLSAMTVIAITYIAEMLPARARGTYQGWIMMIGLCGIPATAFVARLIVPMAPWGWRLVFIYGAAGLLFPLLSRRLEESPRWYEQQGRHDEADAVLMRIEDAARRECGEIASVAGLVPLPAKEGRFLDLFAPGTRARTLMLLAAWIFQTLGFYGFMAWTPTLLVTQGFKLAESLTLTSIFQIGGVFGAAAAGLVSDRFQRKSLIVVVTLAIAASGLAYGLTFDATLIVVFGLLVTFFTQMFAPLLYAYTAECFPTGIRSSGTGLTYGTGRLSNAFGPLIIAFLLSHYGYASVFVYIAACWLAVTLIIGLFGPQTRGRSL